MYRDVEPNFVCGKIILDMKKKAKKKVNLKQYKCKTFTSLDINKMDIEGERLCINQRCLKCYSARLLIQPGTITPFYVIN